jgi:hypothetical protein
VTGGFRKPFDSIDPPLQNGNPPYSRGSQSSNRSSGWWGAPLEHWNHTVPFSRYVEISFKGASLKSTSGKGDAAFWRLFVVLVLDHKEAPFQARPPSASGLQARSVSVSRV